jgi:hypothetical protein
MLRSCHETPARLCDMLVSNRYFKIISSISLSGSVKYQIIGVCVHGNVQYHKSCDFSLAFQGSCSADCNSITNSYCIFMHPTICADGHHIVWLGSIDSSIISEQKSPVNETTSGGQDHRSKLTATVHCIMGTRFL